MTSKNIIMNQIPKTHLSHNFKILKGIGTAAFIAVLVIQNYMRTSRLNYSTQTSHWLGILPNFFGALGICLALYSTHLLKLKRIRLSKNQLFVASFTIPIIGLTAWEFLQILANKPFDINDIYMSIAGSIFGGLIILSSDIIKEKEPKPSIKHL